MRPGSVKLGRKGGRKGRSLCSELRCFLSSCFHSHHTVATPRPRHFTSTSISLLPFFVCFFLLLQILSLARIFSSPLFVFPPIPSPYQPFFRPYFFIISFHPLFQCFLSLSFFLIVQILSFSRLLSFPVLCFLFNSFAWLVLFPSFFLTSSMSAFPFCLFFS